jgi:hypothetical protein
MAVSPDGDWKSFRQALKPVIRLFFNHGGYNYGKGSFG